MTEQSLSVSQAAARLGVSIPTIHSWIRRGALPGAYQLMPGRGSEWIIPEQTVRAVETAREQQQKGQAAT